MSKKSSPKKPWTRKGKLEMKMKTLPSLHVPPPVETGTHTADHSRRAEMPRPDLFEFLSRINPFVAGSGSCYWCNYDEPRTDEPESFINTLDERWHSRHCPFIAMLEWSRPTKPSTQASPEPRPAPPPLEQKSCDRCSTVSRFVYHRDGCPKK